MLTVKCHNRLYRIRPRGSDNIESTFRLGWDWVSIIENLTLIYLVMSLDIFICPMLGGFFSIMQW